MMELIAFRPPPGTWLGFDTVHCLSEDKAREFYDEGYRAVFRYSRRDGTVLDNPIPGGEYGDAVANGCNSLSISESRNILKSGLAIGLVQFGAFGSASYGTQLGAAAAAVTRRLGFPPHHHYMDVEGSAPQSAGAGKVRLYTEAWAAAYNAPIDEDLAGLYYNFTCLDARGLYGLRGVTCYWMAAGPVPFSPHPRGESIRQRVPSEVCGIQVDRDHIRTDNLGDGPLLVGTPEIAAAWYGEAIGHLVGLPFLIN
jgi:hypothetical protein